MKKLTFIIVGLFLFLPVGGTQARESVTLTYMASQNWIPEAEMELGAKFEEETGIHIDYQIIPSDQYFNVLQTRLNTGEATDIFGGQSGVTDLIVNYNVEKNAVDLSDQEWVSRMDPLVVAQATVNSKVYGLTLWDVIGTTWVVNYNKTIFEEEGLSVPTTFDEFKSTCESLLDAGIIPIYEPMAAGWHHVLWFPELGPRYEEVTPGLAEMLNTNQATFADNPTMLTVLEQFKDLYDTGCFGDNTLADTYEYLPEALASGEYAMAVANLTNPQTVAEAFPDVSPDTFGFFVMPLADNQNLNINPAGPTKFIYSGSDHIDEARQYFEFLTRPENLQYLIDNNPAMRTLPFEGVSFNLLPSQQEFLDSFPPEKRGTVYQTAVNYVNPQWMDIGQDLVAMLIEDIKPKDVLETIDERRSDTAKTAKDPAWGD
ncbi:MAG: carbohydrate ABC transporter substrate-binding protein [Chloroflexi bacterium]|nr:carbohydrate ABC transporter substrate-binding protein [Chloroflexota bacterium]